MGAIERVAAANSAAEAGVCEMGAFGLLTSIGDPHKLWASHCVFDQQQKGRKVIYIDVGALSLSSTNLTRATSTSSAPSSRSRWTHALPSLLLDATVAAVEPPPLLLRAHSCELVGGLI